MIDYLTKAFIERNSIEERAPAKGWTNGHHEERIPVTFDDLDMGFDEAHASVDILLDQCRLNQFRTSYGLNVTDMHDDHGRTVGSELQAAKDAISRASRILAMYELK